MDDFKNDDISKLSDLFKQAYTVHKFVVQNNLDNFGEIPNLKID